MSVLINAASRRHEVTDVLADMPPRGGMLIV